MYSKEYTEWRLDFDATQAAIDELEANYWTTMVEDSHTLTHPEAHEITQTYYENRNKLVAKLEALLANTPDM